MSELSNIQQGYYNNHLQTNSKQVELQQAKAAFDKLVADEEKELKGLDARTRAERKAIYERDKGIASAKIDKIKTSITNLGNEFETLAGSFLAQLDPVTKVKELDDAFPLLLFPLRLETRFRTVNNKQQLWLRVYPDDCNINTREDLLSESELNNARSFWIEIWKAGGIETEERGAWRSMVNSHGSGRSALVIQQYKPINNKPSKPNADHKILVVVSALALTVNEHNAAKDYWVACWLAKGNTALIANAFDALKSATSAALADEIVKDYVPVNMGDMVPAGINATKVSLEKLELPAYAAKQTSWTQAAKATLLPDKFVAVLFNAGGSRTVPFEKPVKNTLPVSVDPSLPKNEQINKDANDDLILNKDVQWMTDFTEALEVGMAARIDLSAAEADSGFAQLFVVGIRFKSDKDQSSIQLGQLFTDHFYSKNGFSLLKQGTPTNNTEDLSAGYSWADNADESYGRIFLHLENFSQTGELNKKSDGQKLADYLGIDPDILKNVPNASGSDQLEASAMNTALFPATLGYFMEEMMDPLFTEKDIDATRTFFSNFVSGRGPVPAIRIGKQPYGILPVSVYSRLNFKGRAADDHAGASNRPYLERLHALLMKMDTAWDLLVPGVSFVGKSGDAHQILLDIIGLHANSVEFHQRYSQTIGQLYNQLLLQAGSSVASSLAGVFAQRGEMLLEALNIQLPKGTKLPALEKYFLSEPNLLNGPLVDDVPDSEIGEIRKYSADDLNYIQWLAAADAEKIRIENFGGNAPPTALLYLLLRHALMLAQADAAAGILTNNQVIDSKKIFYDSDFIHIQTNGTGKSKFEHLFDTYPLITGSDSIKLADHIYKPAVLTEAAETRRLNETINALKQLEKTSTAALERLLVEHLDCCNYRIDAWKTGLVNYRLTEQRSIGQQGNDFSKGIYLGAYGWLLDVKPENKVLTNVELDAELTDIFKKGNNTPLQTDSSNLGYIHAPSLNQAAAAAVLRSAYDSNRTAGAGNPFAINLTSNRVRIAAGFLEGMRNGQSLSALLGYQFERGLHDKYSLGMGEVDMFIYPLRKQFPLVADNLVDTKSDASASIETIEANNVIDGLKLINHVKQATIKTYPFGLSGLPPASGTQSTAIDDELTRIMDIHDAIGDLVMSEQVYQVVQGNFERASGNAEAFSKGSYPPDIDIISTPRSGVTITHRMAIQFDAEADPATSPNSVAIMTPKATAEPSINKWLSDLLPDPQKVLCKVTYSSPVQAETEITVSQEDLGLQSIDLLYVFNLDTEQAMTELDDRITHHIRYNISKHPKTDITIHYTSPADAADITKVSFFELAALIKSLRKVITGSKILSPTQLTLAQDAPTLVSLPDVARLKNRITALNNSLVLVKTAVETALSNTISIQSLADTFKLQLQPHITEASRIESIITALKQDLKDYLVNPVIATKNTILKTFEDGIAFITVASVKTNLKNDYGSLLNNYVADFANFDRLAKDTISAFLDMAFFDNIQTGTGFIHEGIAGIYDTVFARLDKLVERWEQKKADINGIMTQYAAAANDPERFGLLAEAEKTVSAEMTLPQPTVLNNYKTIVDNKKASFETLLINLKAIKTNAKQKVTDFIADAEAQTVNIAKHDVVSFDPDKNKNDLGTEKLALALLKENIVTALNNVKNTVTEKTEGCNTLIAEADATVDSNQQITSLQNAAKKILGDEMLVLPQFTLSAAQGNEMANAYIASDATLAFAKGNEKRELPVYDWMAGIARVREKVQEWENVCFLAEAFNPKKMPGLVPLQFPYQEQDRWLALKFRDETDPNDHFAVNSDKLLYTAHFANGFDKTKPVCGVIIDEWTEVIPTTLETTGITFHYDQPDSEPPQTMLLVTPPHITGKWDWNNIIDAMNETLAMAKKRAVEPAQIEGTSYAQFLPSTMMAVTRYAITVATNLSINNYGMNGK